MDVIEVKTCAYCSEMLKEPYIKCEACENVELCLSCFSKGRETGQHLNNHAYEIIHYNFPLFDTSWTAGEEMKLIHSISEYGLGNWNDVSREIKTKTAIDCKWHYYDKYVANAQVPFSDLPLAAVYNFVQPLPITYKTADDPPRPSVNGDSSKEFIYTGYMPARGDFSVDYDNYAEMEICRIEAASQDEDIDTELKLSLLDMYQRRLRERKRRHKVIRNHGLINVPKQMNAWCRFDGSLGRACIQRLIPFVQLFPSAFEFDKYIEGLNNEKELQKKIESLKECRVAGIRKLDSLKLYSRLKQNRLQQRTKRTFLDIIINHSQSDNGFLWKHPLLSNDPSAIKFPARRKPSPPLNIIGLPFYEKLDDKEKELCSNIRLTPEAYLNFKTTLLDEYNKNGQLRLAQARTLIKIDVNKTRKMYDHLLSVELIKQ